MSNQKNVSIDVGLSGQLGQPAGYAWNAKDENGINLMPSLFWGGGENIRKIFDLT